MMTVMLSGGGSILVVYPIHEQKHSSCIVEPNPIQSRVSLFENRQPRVSKQRRQHNVCLLSSVAEIQEHWLLVDEECDFYYIVSKISVVCGRIVQCPENAGASVLGAASCPTSHK